MPPRRRYRDSLGGYCVIAVSPPGRSGPVSREKMAPVPRSISSGETGQGTCSTTTRSVITSSIGLYTPVQGVSWAEVGTLYGEPILEANTLKVATLKHGVENVLPRYDNQLHFSYTPTPYWCGTFHRCRVEGIYSDNVASIFLRNIPENAEPSPEIVSGGTGDFPELGVWTARHGIARASRGFGRNDTQDPDSWLTV